jgi:Asp-tRNA(Asn)/Glu-tRNA(Gln) amidotransferase A subunit family amidase
MPRQDALSVERLKQAEAIILGKATMSTMAYTFDGIDDAAGLVRNPYNPNRRLKYTARPRGERLFI